jgi:hypothetical protein
MTSRFYDMKYLMAWNTRADKSAYRNPEVSAAI